MWLRRAAATRTVLDKLHAGTRVQADYERWGKMVEAVGLMRKD